MTPSSYSLAVLLLLLLLTVALAYTISPNRSKPSSLTVRFLSSSSEGFTISNSKNDNDSTSSAEEIARQLRERAHNLRREAKLAEQSLRSATQQKKNVENKETDEWIDNLLGVSPSDGVEEPLWNNNTQAVTDTPSNNNIPAAWTLALRMRENNLLSPSKLMRICERLHERETVMLMGPEGYLTKNNNDEDVGGGFVLGDYENNSLERKKEESERITGLLDRILQAAQIIDKDEPGQYELGSTLRIRITDLRQSREALIRRKIDNLVNKPTATSNNKGIDFDDLVRNSLLNKEMAGSMDKDNRKITEDRMRHEKMMKRLIETPRWLPPSIAPFAATSPVELSEAHWKMIKSDILADSIFVCTSWEATEVAAIYRGRIITDESLSVEYLFDDLLRRVKSHPDLSKKIQLFIIDDFEWRPSVDVGRMSHVISDKPPPVIIALAKEVMPEQESERSLQSKSLSSFSALATLFTTLVYAVSSFALNPSFFNAVVNENDVSSFHLCLPIFFGVLAVSALHEVGHVVAAKTYGVKLGVPVLLPSLQVGCFGSITPLRSFPKSRSVLFDIAVSGPGTAMLASLAMVVLGLWLTITAQSFTNFPFVPAALMKSSFLVGSIASIVFPKVMLTPLSSPIPIHPLFLIGIAGLYMSSVNLLPIGRLDGGRASMAAWGRRSASLISLASLLLLAFFSFNGLSGIIAFWGAMLVLTRQRQEDIPALNEVSDIGFFRIASYNALLILSLLTIAPFPGNVSTF